MSVAFTQVIKNISNLTYDEKVIVAHRLISSLEVQHDENVDQAWAELAQERFNELKSGKVEGVSWREIKNRIKRRHA